MTRRQLAYLALTLFGGYLVTFAGVAGYVQHVDHQNKLAERAAQVERDRQAEATRKIVCDLANGYLKIYRTNPPATDQQAGVKATWQAMADRFHCPPPPP